MAREAPLRGDALARAMRKAAILRREGTAPDQALAAAVSMERAHRLTDDGRYIHVYDGDDEADHGA